MPRIRPAACDTGADGQSLAPADRAAKGPISRIPYLPGLDGMRALAVVAVMVYHADVSWLPGGFLGVEVFFVISGYLITLLLIGEHERTWSHQPARLLGPARPAPAAGAVRSARRRRHRVGGAALSQRVAGEAA